MIAAILVPLDRSATSEAALSFASWIAKASGAELHLLTVISDPAGRGHTAGAGLDNESSQVHLEAVAGPIRSTGVVVRTELRSGSAADEIARKAEEESVGLVILTTFGEGGDSRHLGGTASRLSRSLRKPALFVSPSSGLQAPLRGPMLVALDGSAAAEATLQPASELAAALQMPLTLLRVAPWAAELFAAFVGLAPVGADEEIELGSNIYLSDLTKRLSDRGPVEYQTLRGRPAQTLIEYARSAGGMLALGAHGHSASHFWSLGSTTDKVLRASPVPVLVVPSPEAVDSRQPLIGGGDRD